MKKLFGLIMALVIVVGLLPFSTFAAAAIPIRINQVQAEDGTELNFRRDWNLMPGDVKYVVSEDNIISEWKDTDAPTDNFVKFEVPADGGHLDVTMKNFHSIDTKSGDWTSSTLLFRKGDYSVTMNVLGENTLQTHHTICIENNASGDFIITGEGSLSVEITDQSSGGIYNKGGDLFIKNTTFIGLQTLDHFYLIHPINLPAGSLAIENAKCTFNTTGGSAIYFGQSTDLDISGHATPYLDADRKLEIKNSNISVKQTDGGNGHGAIVCHNTVIDDNSTIEIFAAKGKPFSKVPSFNGEEYTAIAGLKPATAKTYSPKKNAQYLYFKMTPGLPPETEPTTAPTEPATEPIVDATQPDATQPNTTQPNATQPDTTHPDATEPNATQPTTDKVDDTPTPSNNTLLIILIVAVVLLVLGDIVFAVLYILRKKGII